MNASVTLSVERTYSGPLGGTSFSAAESDIRSPYCGWCNSTTRVFYPIAPAAECTLTGNSRGTKDIKPLRPQQFSTRGG